MEGMLEGDWTRAFPERKGSEELLAKTMCLTGAYHNPQLIGIMTTKAAIIWCIELVDQLLTTLLELRRSLMVELERIEGEDAI
jgi:hypothetical protein